LLNFLMFCSSFLSAKETFSGVKISFTIPAVCLDQRTWPKWKPDCLTSQSISDCWHPKVYTSKNPLSFNISMTLITWT
jgi:hypothetical protein